MTDFIGSSSRFVGSVPFDKLQENIVADKAEGIVYKALRSKATRTLRNMIPTVLDKTCVLCPSGDIHDFFAMAPYWWPNPDSVDGFPYIRKDGQTNPDSKLPSHVDSSAWVSICNDIFALGLAYWCFGKSEYRRRVLEIINTWFVDSSTRMNPHLQYAQTVLSSPSVTSSAESAANDRLGCGCLDGSPFLLALDGVAFVTRKDGAEILDGSEILLEFSNWTEQYLSWFLHSDCGQAASGFNNNHGTWYDVQASHIATWLGHFDIANRILTEGIAKRVMAHIEPDGRQPLELKRTKPIHYSVFNLEALSRLALVGERHAISFWAIESSDGRSIICALDYVLQLYSQQWGSIERNAKGDKRVLKPKLEEVDIRLVRVVDEAVRCRRHWLSFPQSKISFACELVGFAIYWDTLMLSTSSTEQFLEVASIGWKSTSTSVAPSSSPTSPSPRLLPVEFLEMYINVLTKPQASTRLLWASR